MSWCSVRAGKTMLQLDRSTALDLSTLCVGLERWLARAGVPRTSEKWNGT